MLCRGLKSGRYPRMRYSDAINNPDLLEKDLYGNFVAQKIIERRLLCVFYFSEGDAKIVITAYKTSKTEKYTS